MKRIRTFEVGQRVKIIDAKHSWAVDEMFGMIGETHIIDMVNLNNSYRIGVFTWSWQDLEAFKPPKPIIIKPGKFDPGELW